MYQNVVSCEKWPLSLNDLVVCFLTFFCDVVFIKGDIYRKYREMRRSLLVEEFEVDLQ